MNKVEQEYKKLIGLYEKQGADETKLRTCDSLVLESARAIVQLEDLNLIAEKSGLVKVHPKYNDIQKPLPVAAEITKLRASLTNMLTKLDRMLCVNAEEEWDDLDEFE